MSPEQTDTDHPLASQEVEKALDHVRGYIAANGPYDVLLGFSQGAIIITILTALRLKAAREKGAAPPEWLLNVRRSDERRMS